MAKLMARLLYNWKGKDDVVFASKEKVCASKLVLFLPLLVFLLLVFRSLSLHWLVSCFCFCSVCVVVSLNSRRENHEMCCHMKILHEIRGSVVRKTVRRRLFKGNSSKANSMGKEEPRFLTSRDRQTRHHCIRIELQQKQKRRKILGKKKFSRMNFLKRLCWSSTTKDLKAEEYWLIPLLQLLSFYWPYSRNAMHFLLISYPTSLGSNQTTWGSVDWSSNCKRK